MTILAIVCDPPNTLLFGDRRIQFFDSKGVLTDHSESIELHLDSTGEKIRRPHVKVRAHPTRHAIWATAGSADVYYRGHRRLADDVIGTFIDEQGETFELEALASFLAPLVIERGKVAPGGLHALLGTGTEAFYLFLPSDPAMGAPQMAQIEHKIIPSFDTVSFFGGWDPPESFFPPRGSSPETISRFMRALFERAISFAQQTVGPDCDVAGPIDAALVDRVGARILKEN